MQILFLSRWFPFPPDNGAKLRIANLLRGLRDLNEIIFLGFSDNPAVDQKNCDIHALCKRVDVLSWKAYNPNSINAIVSFFNPAPRSIVDTFSKEMGEKIIQILGEERINVVVADSLTMASYAASFEGLPAVFEEMELGVSYDAMKKSSSVTKRFRNKITWEKQKIYLEKLLRGFAATTVVSENERKLFLKTFPDYKSIHVIPNCVNVQSYLNVNEDPVPQSLIFTGSFNYEPNYDAMVWFTADILPKIRAKIPDVILKITGDSANKPFPNASNIIQTGFVEDIKPLVAQSWASITPLRIGGGTRLKILESMALKTPVVATSKGAEGLDLVAGKHLLVADSEDDFAQAVIRLLTHRELRENLVENAFKIVREKYDWARVLPGYQSILEDVVSIKM